MNLDELESNLTEDLAWRKSEINRLFQIAEIPSDEGNIRVHTAILKSLTLLIYSHWEGYVKRSALAYLEFIVRQEIILSNLNPNFHVISLKKSIKKVANAHPQNGKNNINISEVLKHLDEVEAIKTKKFFIKTNFNDPDKQKDSSVIDTGSNLNKEVYKKILETIGIAYHQTLEQELNPHVRQYFEHEKDKSFFSEIIDNTLLKCRNHNAHGGRNSAQLLLGIELLKLLKNLIILLLEQFKDDILEYSSGSFFLQSKLIEKENYDIESNNFLSAQIADIVEQYHNSLEVEEIVIQGIEAINQSA
ncbi:MAE_28990/MAE_18760 family HEPN-like nuclease [Acinetobacter pittii]|uniref:MAE_28990/MAE_18760 family HEPN-like nuclease n=1 Tax=Acinetobacter pittii TaxID=48296 RepID=UPI0005852E85|nr:MAE_28990/MAE_18760 family HEPN-like nuclease [Acinetobacter pittii]KIE84936.1 hypothetical protein SD67_13575 [Acinetobacter pittii]MDO7535582.1 MAE_28990/MAE_18760 family HEPN-like nuclease [Acinetobacter pittii]